MSKISEHITYTEATITNSKYNNTPDTWQLDNMVYLSQNVFEPLRKWYGKPIKVNSFFRSLKVNKDIGGSLNSQHVRGEAIDIDTAKDNGELFHYIRKNLIFDQLIWEFGDERNPSWIHVSRVKGFNRAKILIAYKNEEGKTKYKEWKL